MPMNNKTIYRNNMNRDKLSKLTKKQLIDMLLQKKGAENTAKPVKSLKELAAIQLERSIKRPAKLPKSSISTHVPTLKHLAANSMVRDKIKFLENKARESNTNIISKTRALKGFTKTFEIGTKSDRDALVQLQNTRLGISRLFATILNEMKGFKLVGTLKVTFLKKEDERHIYKPAYFNSKAQIILNPTDFIPSLGLSQQKY